MLRKSDTQAGEGCSEQRFVVRSDRGWTFANRG